MQITRAVLARFAEVTLIPVLHEASQLRAVIFTDRFKAVRMSSVLLAVFLPVWLTRMALGA